MGTSSRCLLRFLGASVACVLIAAALTFTVDPLQLFRPARLFAAMYSPDSRMQDAGLIRSQQFDTAFMGTSLAIHYRQSDIDRMLRVRSLKLAMTGSTAHEQSFVLAAALERRPKRVIWEIDDWIFRDSEEIDSDIYLPADLYRRNIRGIAAYLFSGAMARESAWILARSVPPLRPIIARLTTGVVFRFPLSRVEDINVLRPDADVAEAYNAERAAASFATVTDATHKAYLSEGYDYNAMVRNFERDAVLLVANHPDVTFDFFFPPYSILQWVSMREAAPATLQTVYNFSGYVSRRLAQFPNASLHDFREASETTHDLGNYMDVIHHSPIVDLRVLSWLADGKYLFDRAAPTASLDRLKAQVERYKVEDIGK